MRVADILHSKGAAVVTIQPEATVRELLAVLVEHNVGALVVTRDGTSVDGIVSERDVVRCVNARSDAFEQSVSSIMTADVATSEPGESVDHLMRMMTDHHIRHIPVLVGGHLRGIVSIGDVVKSRIGELELEREQLNSYISGSR